MDVGQQLQTATVLGVVLADRGQLLVRPGAGQREATVLQVRCQVTVVIVEVIKKLLDGERSLVLLDVGHLVVVEDLEVVEEGVQQLGVQGALAVEGHHQPVGVLHPPVATGEAVGDLLTDVGNVTSSFFAGLGLTSNVFMVVLFFSEVLDFLLNLWVVLAHHVEDLVVVFYSSSAVFSGVQRRTGGGRGTVGSGPLCPGFGDTTTGHISN